MARILQPTPPGSSTRSGTHARLRPLCTAAPLAPDPDKVRRRAPGPPRACQEQIGAHQVATPIVAADSNIHGHAGVAPHGHEKPGPAAHRVQGAQGKGAARPVARPRRSICIDGRQCSTLNVRPSQCPQLTFNVHCSPSRFHTSHIAHRP
ncbi:hypothetical protein C2E23DRAFT_847939 [Lenzites betulinus]|nr:hypothetical protein C2E23DRAFT_847939 [Lenzites betulinus]